MPLPDRPTALPGNKPSVPATNPSSQQQTLRSGNTRPLTLRHVFTPSAAAGFAAHGLPQPAPRNPNGLPAAAAPPFTLRHPSWADTATLYQINQRQYTPVGTFRAIEPHLDRLQKMGVSVLWLMPVQPIGRLRRKGTLGSQYSIRDYRAVNP